MINLDSEDYITIIIEAGRVEEGTVVQKPCGEVLYTLTYIEPERHLLRTNYARYGRDTEMVYLQHSSGLYYHYPVEYLLKVKIYKYDLQKEIDDTCEF